MKEEHSKILLQWMVPIVLFIGLLAVMFFNFFTKIKLEGVLANESDMLSVAEEYGEKVHSDLQTMKVAGKTASAILAENEGNEAALEAAKSALLMNTNAYEVVYHQGSGAGIRADGSEVDLTTCSYYYMVYQAADVRHIYAENDGIGGESAVVVVVPLNESITKNILLYYSVETLAENIKMNTEFDSNAFSAVIDANGQILARGDVESAFLQGNNLWSNITDTQYQSRLSRARSQIKNEISGSLQAAVGAEERTLVYYPLSINDWALIIGINQDYVNERENGHWETTSTMLMQLLIIVVIFLGVMIAINMVSKRRNEEKDKMLREKADTDLLTGLNNKLATERKIKEYMEENPNSLGMLFVLDIDNFKKINDNHGHAFGDEVLRSLGNQIGSVFRVTDIIGRTGGDEFMIFLKFLKDDTNTLREAEKLVRFFKDFTAGEYVKYSATASIGAAVFPEHGADFDSLYKSADKALYKAKQRGKNQLAFYDDRDREEKEEI